MMADSDRGVTDPSSRRRPRGSDGLDDYGTPLNHNDPTEEATFNLQTPKPLSRSSSSSSSSSARLSGRRTATKDSNETRSNAKKICCYSSSSSAVSRKSCWKIIAPSPSSRYLMRAISCLGMEDPVFFEQTTTTPTRIPSFNNNKGRWMSIRPFRQGKKPIKTQHNNTVSVREEDEEEQQEENLEVSGDIDRNIQEQSGSELFVPSKYYIQPPQSEQQNYPYQQNNRRRLNHTTSSSNSCAVSSVASDPTADLYTSGMDVAVFQACLRDLENTTPDGLSNYSRQELFLTSRLTMTAKKLRRGQKRQHKPPPQLPPRGEQQRSSSQQHSRRLMQQGRPGLTLDDVLVDASNSTVDGESETGSHKDDMEFSSNRKQQKNDPPKCAVRKKSFNAKPPPANRQQQMPTRDTIPHVVERKESLLFSQQNQRQRNEGKQAGRNIHMVIDKLPPHRESDFNCSMDNPDPSSFPYSTEMIDQTSNRERNLSEQQIPTSITTSGPETVPMLLVDGILSESPQCERFATHTNTNRRVTDLPPKKAKRIESGVINKKDIIGISDGSDCGAKGPTSGVLKDDDNNNNQLNGRSNTVVTCEDDKQNNCHEAESEVEELRDSNVCDEALVQTKKNTPQNKDSQIQGSLLLEETCSSHLNGTEIKGENFTSRVHPSLMGILKAHPATLKQNEDFRVLEEDTSLNCCSIDGENDDEEDEEQYMSTEEGFTESMPEIYSGSLGSVSSNSEDGMLLPVNKEAMNNNHAQKTMPLLPTRKASATRQCIAALCRENPRRAPAIASLAASLYSWNPIIEVFVPKISSNRTDENKSLHEHTLAQLSTPNTNTCSQGGRNSPLHRTMPKATDENQFLVQPKIREKLSKQPPDTNVLTGLARLENRTQLRRPVRKDSPFVANASSPRHLNGFPTMRGGQSDKEKLVSCGGLSSSSPQTRDCKMSMPKRVQSGHRILPQSTSKNNVTSRVFTGSCGTDTPVDGESTFVINNAEITVCSQSVADEELSIPSYTSYLTVEEEESSNYEEDDPGNDETCGSAESTIAFNATMESDRDLSSSPARNGSNITEKQTKKSQNGINNNDNICRSSTKRGVEIARGSCRSTDSTVSFPIQRWDELNLTRHSELNPVFSVQYPSSTQHTQQTKESSIVGFPGSGESILNNATNHTANSFGETSWITEESESSKLDCSECVVAHIEDDID